MQKKYVQYGCGLSAPVQWENFDASPTLRIQKIPIVNTLIGKKLNTIFPENVLYGDIIKGLPVDENSCKAVYCSHTLEHLSLEDFRRALKNTIKILEPGGVFRCVVPDLEVIARKYIDDLDKGDKEASIKFFRESLLGVEKRDKSLKSSISSFWGNSHHLWMWDHLSLSNELKNAGFKNVRKCQFNDSKEDAFKLVEEKARFVNAVAIESIK